MDAAADGALVVEVAAWEADPKTPPPVAEAPPVAEPKLKPPLAGLLVAPNKPPPPAGFANGDGAEPAPPPKGDPDGAVLVPLPKRPVPELDGAADVEPKRPPDGGALELFCPKSPPDPVFAACPKVKVGLFCEGSDILPVADDLVKKVTQATSIRIKAPSSLRWNVHRVLCGKTTTKGMKSDKPPWKRVQRLPPKRVARLQNPDVGKRVPETADHQGKVYDIYR